MRIIQLIKTANGASWAWRQVRELIVLGHEVHVVLPEEGTMALRYAEVGATVHYLACDIAQLRTPLLFARRAKQLRELVRSIAPQIVHSHFVGTTMMMRIALAGLDIPRLFQVPGLLHLENPVTRQAEYFTSSSRDYWAASCKRTRQIYLDQGIEARRVGLAYYGNDFTRRKSLQRGKLRSELGIAHDEPIVGMVAYAYAPKRWLGYRRGIKGHEDLIDAIAVLHNRGICVHGVFVGGAWAGADKYFSEIVEYGRERLGRYGHFLGTRHDVEELYEDFNVVAHPSHSENLGGAAESLALAVPTIATDVGGFPDIVIDSITGWLATVKNPVELADVIGHVLRDPQGAALVANNGREFVADLLDARNTSAQIAYIYRAILDGNHLPC